MQTRDAVDWDEEPDEPVVTMQMRQVQLGTFDCGACQVAFSEKAIRFHTSEATRFQPHGYHKEIELEMTALTKIEIDKERGVMCVTGFFGYNVPEHYSSFSDGPKSRVLFHFVSGEGAGVWHGSDRANQTKSLMLLSPDIKQKTSFNPTGRDFAAELQRLKDGLGQQAATAATTKPPPTGKGSKSVPRQPGPYMIFCKAERSKVVAANPSMAFGEVSSVLSSGHPHRWPSLLLRLPLQPWST